MELDTFLSELKENPDREELIIAVRAYARLALKQRQEEANKVVGTLARLRMHPEFDDWTCGLVEAIEAINAVLKGAHERRQSEEEVAVFMKGDVWKRIANQLQTWTQPSAIAEELSMDRAQVSRTLSDMAKHDLVEWRKDPSDGRVRLYQLSPNGRNLISMDGRP